MEGEGIHLHGGVCGFGKKVFSVEEHQIDDHAARVTLYYRSPELEEGYPGNLDVWITYTLTAKGQIQISYRAATDKETHLNLTNHTYFNLNGGKHNILTHEVFIDADYFVATDERYLPTGIILPVAGTPYSFKRPKVINSDIDKLRPRGYNECYVLNKNVKGSNAIVYCKDSDRRLRLQTDMPGLLLYTGDYLHGKFQPNAGLCLETQYFPDSPNQPTFPSTLIKPGQQWSSFTSLDFDCI